MRPREVAVSRAGVGVRMTGVPSSRSKLRLPVRGPNFPESTERVKREVAAIVECSRVRMYSAGWRAITRRIEFNIAAKLCERGPGEVQGRKRSRAICATSQDATRT